MQKTRGNVFCNSFLLLSTGCNHFFLILIVSTTVEPLCLLAYSVVTNRPVPASLPRLMVIVLGITKRFLLITMRSHSRTTSAARFLRDELPNNSTQLVCQMQFPCQNIADNDKMSVLFYQHALLLQRIQIEFIKWRILFLYFTKHLYICKIETT